MTAPVFSRRGRRRDQRALWTVLIGLLAVTCRLAPAMGEEPMGAGPEQHGITSNKWQRAAFTIAPVERGPEGIFPTIFGIVRAARPAAAIGVFHD